MDTKNRLQKTPRALACFGWKGGDGREGREGREVDVGPMFFQVSPLRLQ